MESFGQISSFKSLLEQGLNCWLQYVIAQPINLDLQIMSMLTLQFLGMPKLISWFENVKPIINNIFKIQNNELMLEQA